MARRWPARRRWAQDAGRAVSDEHGIDHVKTFLAIAGIIGRDAASRLATYIANDMGHGNFTRFPSELCVVGPWAWVSIDEHRYAWLGQPRRLQQKLDGLQMLLNFRPPAAAKAEPVEVEQVRELTRQLWDRELTLSRDDYDDAAWSAVKDHALSPRAEDGWLIFQSLDGDGVSGQLDEVRIELSSGGVLHRTVLSWDTDVVDA